MNAPCPRLNSPACNMIQRHSPNPMFRNTLIMMWATNSHQPGKIALPAQGTTPNAAITTTKDTVFSPELLMAHNSRRLENECGNHQCKSEEMPGLRTEKCSSE